MYLRRLHHLNGKRPLALFMDNLKVHKTEGVRRLYKSLNIGPLFNIPYSPSLNPVEACFSIVKNHYKKRRLQHLVNDEAFDAAQLIEEAFAQVDAADVSKCVARSKKAL